MIRVSNPERSQWRALMQRAASECDSVTEIVADIISDVKRGGDNALFRYAERFEKAMLNTLRVTDIEISEAVEKVDADLKSAINRASENIARFHAAQKRGTLSVEVLSGITCYQKSVAIESVGLYIPGGNSPLFSTVLMLAIPARLAGCRDIVLCTPASSEGSINPAILYAAHISGVTAIYKVGGAQAVAAMAYGTESIPKVSKIFGPGNRFVMEAKKQVAASGVAIDMPAGPSEVMIIADDNADLDFIATDFLSQAEHGPDSQSILLTDSPRVADELPVVIERHLNTLPRQEMMRKSLSHSRIIEFDNQDDIWDFANEYAPEHLIINCVNADELTNRVKNAGSVFLGSYSPESVGDYASGTNHTLPTGGYAKAYSGVNMDSFVKKITFQRLTSQGLASIADTVEIMAEEESLMAHKLAVTVRMEKLKNR